MWQCRRVERASRQAARRRCGRLESHGDSNTAYTQEIGVVSDGRCRSGHHGPSVSVAASSFTSDTVPDNVARRGTCAPSFTRNTQFSPLARSRALLSTSSGGGFGPYVVHGPGTLAGQCCSSCGGEGSPKYSNSSFSRSSTTGKIGDVSVVVHELQRAGRVVALRVIGVHVDGREASRRRCCACRQTIRL
jgi:hypothetical protein